MSGRSATDARPMNARVLFVTGTDTGVGKTTITTALIAAWVTAGRRVAALKPVETGCRRRWGQLHPADGMRLAAASRQPPTLVSPLRYAAPTSPAAAATLAGRPIDRAAIFAAANALGAEAELLVVEGAGGLLVPLDDQWTMADLAVALGARLLVVARASLGTVNHSCLTVEAARHRGLAPIAVVLNRVVAHLGADEASNPAAIARFTQLPVWGPFPHLEGRVRRRPLAELGVLARRHLPVDALWELATAQGP